MTIPIGPGREERLTFTLGPHRAVTQNRVAPPAPRADAATAVAQDRILPEPESGDAAFTWLLVFTAVLFFRPQDLIPPLAALHLAELSAIAGLIAMITGRLSRREAITRMTPELGAVLAFGAMILLTAPFSVWMGGSVGVFTEVYAKVILVYLLAVNAVSSPKRLERLTWILVLAVAYVGFRAVVDYARGTNLVGHGTRVRGSVGGVLENPNDLALNMVVFIPLAAFLAVGPGSLLKRATAGLCVVFMLGAVVASGSRGGALGLAAMTAVTAAFMVRRAPGIVLAGVVAAICALPVLPANYWHRLESITDASKDDTGSREARRVLLSESLQAYVQHPLVGVGAGEFKNWNNDKREQAWHESHNVLLQVASELGTIALLVFLFMVGRAFFAVYETRRLLRRRLSRRTAARAPVLSQEEAAMFDAHSAAMVASLVGWCVCAMFASVAYNWTFYYLLALAATPREMLRGRVPAAARRKPRTAAAAPRLATIEGGAGA